MDLKKIAVLSCMSFLSLSAYSAPSDSTLLLDKVDRLENHILLLEKKLSELKFKFNANDPTRIENGSGKYYFSTVSFKMDFSPDSFEPLQAKESEAKL